jgi:hypothetical protein
MVSISYHRFLLFLVVLASGCAPMREINIRVLKPAEVTLPAHVQRLAFMNRSVLPMLFARDTSGWSREEYFIVDTLMRRWIFQGLRNALTESPLYDLDTIQVIVSRRLDTSNLLNPISPLEREQIREDHSADALISLEYYNIHDSLHVKKINQNWSYEAYMAFNVLTIWRIYDLVQDTLIDEYALRDTTRYYAYDYTSELAIQRLPRALNAIREAGYQTGRSYGYRISPGWIEEPRFYYNRGGGGLHKAGKKAVKEDWESASGIWKSLVYESDKKRVAAKASFNMALVCEMEDLLIPALDWAIKSYSIQQKPLTREYIEVLQKRNKERKLLDKQIPR